MEKENEEIKLGAMWHPLPLTGFEFYWVSRCGEVYNSRTKKKLKLGESNAGYLQVCLHSQAGEPLVAQVGRLVAMAFIPNPDNLPEVHHIDGNKHNNLVTNISWVSRSENLSTPEIKEIRRKNMNAHYADPAWRAMVRERRTAAVKAYWADVKAGRRIRVRRKKNNDGE